MPVIIMDGMLFRKKDIYSLMNCPKDRSILLNQECYLGNSFDELNDNIKNNQVEILEEIDINSQIDSVFKTKTNKYYGLLTLKSNINELSTIRSKPKISEAFKVKIKRLRLSKNLSRSELGCIVHVTASTVANWENKGLVPRYDTLESLADYFRLTIDDLL